MSSEINNKMTGIKIEKLTLNYGAGADQKNLAKGITLIKKITGKTPVKTKSKKRIPTWNLRIGLPIGAKLTLRENTQVTDLIKRFLEAKEGVLSKKNFDDNGNISFGIHEYVDIPGVKYDPDLGILGFEISVTLERPGFRIKKRKVMKRKVPIKHRISVDDSISFMKKEFNLQIMEEQESDL